MKIIQIVVMDKDLVGLDDEGNVYTREWSTSKNKYYWSLNVKSSDLKD